MCVGGSGSFCNKNSSASWGHGHLVALEKMGWLGSSGWDALQHLFTHFLEKGWSQCLQGTTRDAESHIWRDTRLLLVSVYVSLRALTTSVDEKCFSSLPQEILAFVLSSALQLKLSWNMPLFSIYLSLIRICWSPSGQADVSSASFSYPVFTVGRGLVWSQFPCAAVVLVEWNWL